MPNRANVLGKPEIARLAIPKPRQNPLSLTHDVHLKISGICGMLAPVTGFIFIGLSIALYPQFSWFDDALSDLGVMAGAKIFFNAGLILSGLLALTFGTALPTLFRRQTVGVLDTFIFLFGSLALLLIGVFPENVRPIHYYVSVVFFVFTLVSMFLIGGELLLSSRVKIGIFSLATAAFATAVWVVQFAMRPFPGVAIPETLSGLAASAWVAASGFKLFKSASPQRLNRKRSHLAKGISPSDFEALRRPKQRCRSMMTETY